MPLLGFVSLVRAAWLLVCGTDTFGFLLPRYATVAGIAHVSLYVSVMLCVLSLLVVACLPYPWHPTHFVPTTPISIWDSARARALVPGLVYVHCILCTLIED